MLLFLCYLKFLYSQNCVYRGTRGIFCSDLFPPGDDSRRFLFFFLFSLTWTLFFIFTFLHLYANFRAVSSVVMETVSLPRLHLLVTEYLYAGRIMTPEEVGSREPVVFGKSCLKNIKA